MFRDALSKVDRSKFVLFTSLLVLVVVVEIFFTAIIPLWREHFYDVLEAKDQDNFYKSLTYFTGLMLGLGFSQGLKVWAGQLVSFEMRKASTKLLFKKWVKGDREIPNYTQAMTEALRNATEMYLMVGTELFISFSIVISLIFVNLDQPVILQASAVYTGIMIAVAVLFNRPMVNADAGWQKEEGYFRETLSYIYSGNDCFTFKEKLENISLAYYRYIKVVMYFALFSRLKGALGSLVPYILLSYPYFAGEITLGAFMKGVASFELIVINSTIIVIVYPNLTKARASLTIAKEFYSKIKNREV